MPMCLSPQESALSLDLTPDPIYLFWLSFLFHLPILAVGGYNFLSERYISILRCDIQLHICSEHYNSGARKCPRPKMPPAPAASVVFLAALPSWAPSPWPVRSRPAITFMQPRRPQRPPRPSKLSPSPSR